MTGEIIKQLISYFGSDVRRINHALKVYGFAKSIGEKESLSDEQMLVLEASAVLHDIGIKESEIKYGSSDGKYQELEGPPIARRILQDIGFEEGLIERVCFITGNHHSYGKIDGIDFQILVEADFLVNIFEADFNREMIKSVTGKYFKTAAGIDLAKRMYTADHF